MTFAEWVISFLEEAEEAGLYLDADKREILERARAAASQEGAP